MSGHFSSRFAHLSRQSRQDSPVDSGITGEQKSPGRKPTKAAEQPTATLRRLTRDPDGAGLAFLVEGMSYFLKYKDLGFDEFQFLATRGGRDDGAIERNKKHVQRRARLSDVSRRWRVFRTKLAGLGEANEAKYGGAEQLLDGFEKLFTKVQAELEQRALETKQSEMFVAAFNDTATSMAKRSDLQDEVFMTTLNNYNKERQQAQAKAKKLRLELEVVKKELGRIRVREQALERQVEQLGGVPAK